jgi:hypothetical protein
VSRTHGPGVRGRPFAKGNPGRKRGSKNRAALISAALLEGEQPELLRLAIDIAKRGNVPMLKYLLARWLPRERLITINLPRIVSGGDALKALQHILRAVSAGEITPRGGSRTRQSVSASCSSKHSKAWFERTRTKLARSSAIA